MPSLLQPYSFSKVISSYTRGIWKFLFFDIPLKGILVFGFRRLTHRKVACHGTCWHKKPRGYSYNFDKGRYDPLCHRTQCSVDKSRGYCNRMEYLLCMRKSSTRALTQRLSWLVLKEPKSSLTDPVGYLSYLRLVS